MATFPNRGERCGPGVACEWMYDALRYGHVRRDREELRNGAVLLLVTIPGRGVEGEKYDPRTRPSLMFTWCPWCRAELNSPRGGDGGTG